MHLATVLVCVVLIVSARGAAVPDAGKTNMADPPLTLGFSDQPGQPVEVQRGNNVTNDEKSAEKNEIPLNTFQTNPAVTKKPIYSKYKNTKTGKQPLISSGYASTRNQGYTKSPSLAKTTERTTTTTTTTTESTLPSINIQDLKTEQKPLKPTQRPYVSTIDYKPTTYVPKIPLVIPQVPQVVPGPGSVVPVELKPKDPVQFQSSVFELKVTPKPFGISNSDKTPPVVGEVLDDVPDIIYDYDDERNQGEGVLFLTGNPQTVANAPSQGQVQKVPVTGTVSGTRVTEGTVPGSVPTRQAPPSFKFPTQDPFTQAVPFNPAGQKPFVKFPELNPQPADNRENLPNILPHFRPNANPQFDFSTNQDQGLQGNPVWPGPGPIPQPQVLPGPRPTREPQRSPLNQLSQAVAGFFGRRSSNRRISSRIGEVEDSSRTASAPNANKPQAVYLYTDRELRRGDRPYLVIGPQEGPPPQIDGAKLVHAVRAAPQQHQGQPHRRESPAPGPGNQLENNVPLRPKLPTQQPVSQQPANGPAKVPGTVQSVPVPQRVPLNPAKDIAAPVFFDPNPVQKTPAVSPGPVFSVSNGADKPFSQPIVERIPQSPQPVSSNKVALVQPTNVVKSSEKPGQPTFVNFDAPFFPSVSGPSDEAPAPPTNFEWYVVNSDKPSVKDSSASASDSRAVVAKPAEPVFHSGFVPFNPTHI